MARVLVWPWHGPLVDNKVTLKNGSTRPCVNPSDFDTLPYGPGDTHRIRVPDVPPLTLDEVARTPPGGEYWAGTALISANRLYNTPLDGWIYQAPDGTRWRCAFSATNTASTCRILLRITQFGAFDVAPGDTYFGDLSFAVDEPDREMRLKFWADLGQSRDIGIRLHAVSDSGATAIVAATMFNNRDTAGVADALHRPYAFIKVGLVKSEEGVVATGEVLYGPSQVMSLGTYPGFETLRYGLGDMVEEDRQPIVDQSGNHVGDTVTYSFDPTMVMEVIPYDPSQLRGPISYTRVDKWIPAVGFEGETPRPWIVQCTESASRALTTLSAVTVSQRIQREYFSGQIETVQAGEARAEGTASAQGEFSVRVSGPGSAWARSSQWSTSSQIVGEDVQVQVMFNGKEAPFGEASYGDAGVMAGAQFGGNGVTRRPQIYCGHGPFDIQWQLDLYSNNCIGVSQADNQGQTATEDSIPLRLIGAYTSAGFLARTQPYPEVFRHYGSFNPATEEFVIGSPVPVSWT
ncbi:hypothetical protein [Pseudomonas rhizosphaerae]|uniref:hypothetical protein n=1 Tax=Pseudomonas rhizosphaerae TaxID=216142 RepID=UPI002B467306|nr:hypothetical protein [Pseudomonas rhizosphaerae]MEB2870307.1 hypothetical protein [Pseudomonas rhizosphaerae]